MSERESTRYHNIDFIKHELGFTQLGNSAVFKKGVSYLLSPAVSQGEHHKFWIDIREANLNKLDPQKTVFLPRIVPDLFLCIHLNNLSSLLLPELGESRSHSGNVWGIYMNFQKAQMKMTLYSKRDSLKKVDTEVFSKKTVIDKLNSII
ncbi:MAG: hypothetical protein SD837_18675 [Candidatus Electrothrix scaldis]|nr:MAG: hypothetical protein SD837_18675 [Candidatus Electrothrix sp. GW3-3]